MKKKRGSVSRALSRTLGLPAEVFGGASVVSISACSEVMVSGCSRVEEYESGLVRLSLCDTHISVTGEGLTLKTYFGTQIQVRGRISEVKFY